jgi:hypothetical protein
VPNIRHLLILCRAVNHNRQELAPQTAQAAAITGSYHDDDSKDDDDDLLDDLGEN